MPPQDRRRWLPAATALTGLAIGLALGILLTPNTTTPPADPTDTPTDTPTTAATPTATPTVADGDGNEAGRTEAGAIAAALEWMHRFTPALYLDDDAREQAVSEVAAADAEAALLEMTADVADRFREIGVTPEIAENGVRVAVPAGYDVRSFTPDAAEVAVWVAQVIDLGEVSPLNASWDTQVTTMRWEDGGWRLVAVESIEGPIPEIAAQGDGQLPRTLSTIESFTEFDYEP